jgi:glutamate racemase
VRIGITDSGTGGLSVCAEVEARLREDPHGGDIEVLYLNAAFRDDFSYNALDSRQEKIEIFGRFLDNVAEHYRPDFLYIACNSLSVLYEDAFFDRRRAQYDIAGIIETGTRKILEGLDRNSATGVIVFATPTTVAEGSYPARLARAGIDPGRVVQQACPGLPDAISNDFSGAEAEALLRDYVPEALAQFERLPAAVTACLACTHYGYQAGLFHRLLGEHLADVRVINPNRAAAGDIINALPRSPEKAETRIRFITPHAIPARPLASLTHYLGGRAPRTVAALQAFTVDSNLYRG